MQLVSREPSCPGTRTQSIHTITADQDYLTSDAELSQAAQNYKCHGSYHQLRAHRLLFTSYVGKRMRLRESGCRCMAGLLSVCNLACGPASDPRKYEDGQSTGKRARLDTSATPQVCIWRNPRQGCKLASAEAQAREKLSTSQIWAHVNGGIGSPSLGCGGKTTRLQQYRTSSSYSPDVQAAHQRAINQVSKARNICCPSITETCKQRLENILSEYKCLRLALRL